MISGPDLSRYDNSWYSPGRGVIVRSLWFAVGLPILRSSLNPSSALKRGLLRMFGARVGKNVVLKPGVVVKYPWLLAVGENSWIGEGVCFDNVAQIKVGSNVCISQAVYLCTGNHDWSDPGFRLVLGPIAIESGAWLCLRSTICPGVTIGQRAVVCAGAVVNRDIPAEEIHAGNPARFIRLRTFQEEPVHSTAGA